MLSRKYCLLVAPFLLLTAADGQEKKPQGPRPKVNIPALIDRLADIGDSDVGYSPYVTGSVFTPLDSEGAFHAGLLFQKPSVQSDTVRELVKQGATALPHLLEHLGDKRKTKIRISHGGFFGGLFVTEDENDKEKAWLGGPRGLTLRVGDLCYVAIGQIVNRHYNAVRYQPTAIIFVESPVRSTALRKEIQKEWSGLTPAKHKASLLKDLEAPEHLDSGACKRLAYYYPEALEAPALKILAEPTYDVFITESLVREKLYKAKTPAEAEKHFDAFLKKHGDIYRYGIMVQLFDDLGTLEAHEEKRLSPPLTRFGEQPRQLLVQLFGKDKKIRSKDQPKKTKTGSAWTNGEFSRFIEEGLIYDENPKIDEAIRKILTTTKDDGIALACMKRLVVRGFDADIEAYLRKRAQDKYYDESFTEMKGRLGWSRLHVAVERKQADWVRGWIAQGKDVNGSGKTGDTPLHVAAKGGNGKAADLLLSAKAKVDAKNRAGQTPVQLAVAEDHLEFARKLLDHGCAVPDASVAAYAGRVDLLENFLKADKSALQKTTRSKSTLLHLAASAGQTKAVAFLLEHGAKVDATEDSGYTPLHLACGQGHEEAVRELLAKKADTQAKTKYSELQPLHLATLAGKLGVAKILITEKAPLKATVGDSELSIMHLAARAGHRDLLAFFHSKGLSVDESDKNKMTPLHHAAEFGQKSCVEFLIEKKANVNGGAKGEQTPLHLAVKGGHIEVVALLLRHKANVSPEGSLFVGTPLQIANTHEEPEIAELLKKHGAKK
jgi:ankyrin repeat protein